MLGFYTFWQILYSTIISIGLNRISRMDFVSFIGSRVYFLIPGFNVAFDLLNLLDVRISFLLQNHEIAFF